MPIKISEEKFVATWNELNSPQAVANALEIDVRSVYRRRNALIQKGYILPTIKAENKFDIESVKELVKTRLEATKIHARRGVAIENARVVVFSDAHFYPDQETTAYRALLEFIKEFRPEIIVANGDLFDGTSISKHSRIMWENAPSVKEELEAVTENLNGIENASRFKSNLIWTFGNHDQRFASYLASSAPQYEGVSGFSLKDHFPLWQPCWSYWINDTTVIKHRYKGGQYAGYNNQRAAGPVNIVTGHTHVLAVQPITNYGTGPKEYQQTFYGVQTGTLANPNSDQFVNYTEDNPKDWRSGFVVLTFQGGQLLMPEIVQVWDEEEGIVQFRGKLHYV